VLGTLVAFHATRISLAALTVRLPEPIAAYFAATSTHNVDAMLAGFADGAVVRDEGQERRGRAAIRE
jgi:hypothetical protein